ncbi:ABC transporter permease [Paenibacillus arenilitoris]|uniref:ABC transporter permease subunit n=1 Tax=Paenibacillus arenilitoris TaxID=2772299 RepID=A0A927H7D1_9BACL|nr:ABC transporter permease subunit [Paenibacillus arenilitoris]MBD2870905.1 ABC transporter permease subunit [Paenibacillus arenilitoris]
MRTASLPVYLVMVQKELLELVRSFKLLWVPLVFVLLGIMQPVSIYYMPLLLESAGNLPDGTVIDIPMPLGSEVLAQTLRQFGTLGMLILALASMGVVSGERNSGAASLILVKPVSTLSYIGSKWTSMLLLTWGSLSAGYLASWYYTGLLIGEVAPGEVLGSLLAYGLWLSFATTMTLLFGTMLRSPAAAAFSSLGLSAALSLLSGLFPKQLGWNPGALSGYAYQLAADGVRNPDKLWWAVSATALLIALALAASAALLGRSPAVD